MTRKKLISLLVLLMMAVTGAWAQSGENFFQYCYDCQRSPAYPTVLSSATLSGFTYPYVSYNNDPGIQINTCAGPWKLEYMGIWSSTDNYGINSDDVEFLEYIYGSTDVPIFRLYQWNPTANEYQHAAYGVVCAYANVNNVVDHTVLFVADGHWGCVLTNKEHSSSMNVTFDEDLATGLTTLITAATPSAPVTYTVSLKGGTTDAANWTISPTEAAASTQVTATYSGTKHVKSVKAVKKAPVLSLTISKGSTELSSDKILYYVAGDTYRQALARTENQSTDGLGWGCWESSSLTTVYFKEDSNTAWDMAIDGDSNFASGKGSCAITLDTEIDPTGYTFQFVSAQ